MKKYDHYCIRCDHGQIYDSPDTRRCLYCGEPMTKVFEQDLDWDYHETENEDEDLF
jgi:hypothetical protein